ncbi:MAG: hypothetical protein AB7N71_13670 [Phycisphaerae bacterium]
MPQQTIEFRMVTVAVVPQGTTGAFQLSDGTWATELHMAGDGKWDMPDYWVEAAHNAGVNAVEATVTNYQNQQS